MSAFIVETDNPGFAVGETNDMLGLRASEAVDVMLRDCRVPKGNLLGELNQGFAIAREIVEGGRIDIAAQAVGIGEACLAQSIAKAKDRKQLAGRSPSSRRSSGWWPTCRPRSTPRRLLACPRRGHARDKSRTMPD